MKSVCATLILLLLAGCGSSSIKEKQANGGEKQGLFAKVPERIEKPKEKAKPKATGIMGKKTDDIVDMQKAMKENPNLTILEHGKGGGGYLGAVSGAYISGASRAGSFGMISWINTYKALEGHFPPYEEFMKTIKKNHDGFPQMPSYLTYAYDSKTGTIVLLEDKTKQ